MELHHIKDINDPLVQVIKDDPVRPHIPLEQRVNNLAEILLLKAGEEILAATCMQFTKDIPEDEQDLIDLAESNDVAVFYTIWSYKPGAGRRLIAQARAWIQHNRSYIKNFVTLSPPTDMARVFHLKNGAEIFRVNPDTVNYLYP